jgi:hypothetical protein
VVVEDRDGKSAAVIVWLPWARGPRKNPRAGPGGGGFFPPKNPRRKIRRGSNPPGMGPGPPGGPGGLPLSYSLLAARRQ